MIIGIDVGGTFTDGVAVEDARVVVSIKVPTGDVIKSLSEVLDRLIRETKPGEWQRLVISTTMLTNIIAQGREERIALLLIPGPGVNPSAIPFPGEWVVFSGAVNFRGQVIEELDEKTIRKKVKALYGKGFRQMAVVGKFSGRNRVQEIRIAEIIHGMYPDVSVTLGHRCSSYLNFPRRVVTAWLMAATGGSYKAFIDQVKEVLNGYRLPCPVFIMKADGGVIPLEAADDFAVDTVYSGPAASTMGALSLLPADQSAIVMDIGGTTTDLSLILSGTPLMASRGLRINGYLTQTKGLAMKPVPLGGDSPVVLADGKTALLSERRGQAACFGGSGPTLTDALNILDGVPGVSVADSRKVFESILPSGDVASLAAQAVDAAVEKIAVEVGGMIREWQDEPAYHVWEVLHQETLFPDLLVGIGGGAAGLTKRVAEKLAMKHLLPAASPVANAIGCAVAKPTLSCRLHLDTGSHLLSLDDGTQEAFSGNCSEEKGISLAKEYLARRLAFLGVTIREEEMETLHSEVFQMIRGYSQTGQIIDVEVQVKPGLITRIIEILG